MQGRVTGVGDDLFAAEFDGPLVATFGRALLPDVEPGDIIEVVDNAVHRVDFGTWTQEELDAVRERARRMVANLGPVT